MIDYFLMPHPPIIIPEVGKGAEKEVSKTIESCSKVGDIIEQSDAETIVIITPHGTVFRDAVAMINTDFISGDFGSFEAPDVTLTYDIDLALTKEIINELRVTLSKVDSNEVEELVNQIKKADKIFFVGVGRVLLSLEAIAKRLAHLGINTVVVGQITEPAITDKNLLIVLIFGNIMLI